MSPDRFTYSDATIRVAPVYTAPDSNSIDPIAESSVEPKPLHESARTGRALNGRARTAAETEPARGGRRLGSPHRPRSIESEVSPTPDEPLLPQPATPTPIAPRSASQRVLKAAPNGAR